MMFLPSKKRYLHFFLLLSLSESLSVLSGMDHIGIYCWCEYIPQGDFFLKSEVWCIIFFNGDYTFKFKNTTFYFYAVSLLKQLS